MPEHVLFPEFRDELEFAKYPFGDNASLQSDTGEVIPPELFLDGSLYPQGAVGRVYISKIIVTPPLVTIIIGDEKTQELASATMSPVDTPDTLVFEDPVGRPAGVLVSSAARLAIFGAWPSGTHSFRVADSEFVASVVIPIPAMGVRGLVAETGEILVEDVWLVGNRGVVVRLDGDNIRVDIVGDPLFARRLCDPVNLFIPTQPIRTVNGCPPDSFGNYNLTVGSDLAEDTILRLYPENGMLKIAAVGKHIG